MPVLQLPLLHDIWIVSTSTHFLRTTAASTFRDVDQLLQQHLALGCCVLQGIAAEPHTTSNSWPDSLKVAML